MTTKALFKRRDALMRKLADTEAQLRAARSAHYGNRAGMPRMEAFRREVVA